MASVVQHKDSERSIQTSQALRFAARFEQSQGFDNAQGVTMSRFSIVRQGSAFTSARTGVVCCIALGAIISTGCGNGPPPVGPRPVQQPGQPDIKPPELADSLCSSQKPAASDTNVDNWARYAHCLKPAVCFVSKVPALVWQSGPANKISVQVGPNTIDIDLATQDASEAQDHRPDLWRHVPSNPPELWQGLPSTQPGTSNAKIAVLEGSTVATKLGITKDNGIKWPECSPLGVEVAEGKLTPTTITLTGSDGSRHTVHGGASSRRLDFDNLAVTLPDYGEPWPASITKISADQGSVFSVEGSSGHGSVDLLNESFVPRPLVVDLTSVPAALKLTCNGLARFSGAESASCHP